MALTDLTRISTSGIATGSTIDSPILRKDVSLRGSQVGVTSALFDSSDDALEFNDNVKLKFGNSGDMMIYHDGSHSHIFDNGTGDLRLTTGGQKIDFQKTGGEILARFYTDGANELYYDGTKRFNTTSTGAVVTGILTATSFSGGGGISAGVVTCTGLDLNGNGDVSGNFVIGGDLTVNGTTTTLDTNLTEVDRIEVGANSNTLAGIAVTQSGSADIINLFDGGTNVLTVTDTGDVGINRTNPDQRLNVSGNIEVNSYEDPNGQNGYNTSKGLIIGNGHDAGISGLTDDRNAIIWQERGLDLDFGTNNTFVMKLHHQGKVGVGITNPTEKFEVKSGNIAIVGGSGYKIDTHPLLTTASFTDISGGAYAARLGSTGSSTIRSTQIYGGGNHIATFDGVNYRLGISTTAPQTKLEASSATGTRIRARHTNTTGARDAGFDIWSDDSGTFAARASLVHSGSGGKTTLYAQNRLNIHSDQTTTSLYIARDGKVGIGTDNPSTPLHVYHATTNGVAVFQSGDAYCNLILQDSNSTTSSKPQFGVQGDDFRFISYNGSSSTEKLRIKSNGKIGIGTDNPTAALDVRDASGSDPTFFVGHSEADVIGEAIRIGRVAPYQTIRYHSIKAEHSGGASSNMLAFHLHTGGSGVTDQVEVMQLRGDGRVSMGGATLTYNGTDTFELQPASATPAVFIGDSNRTDAGQHLTEFRGNWNGTSVARMVVVAGDRVSQKDNGELVFFTAPSGSMIERLRIKSSGQIRIDQATSANNGIRIRPSGWNYDFRMGAVSTSGGSIWLGQNYDPTGSAVDSSSYGTNYIQFTTNGEIYFGTGATNTLPDTRLKIASDGKLTHTYDIGTNGNAGLVLNTDDASKASSILFQANTENRARIDVQRLAGDGAQLKIQVSQMNNSNTMLDAITIAPVSSGDTTPDVTLTGNLKLASGNGIDFSSNTDGGETSTFTTLEDYEEGTFTPHFEIETRGSEDSPVDGVQARYVKVGNVVTCHYMISCNGTPSERSTARAWEIHGFPYQAKNGNSSGQMGGSQRVTGYETATYGPDGYFVFRLFNNTTYGRLEFIESNYNGTRNASTMMQNNAQVIGTITYQTDG